MSGRESRAQPERRTNSFHRRGKERRTKEMAGIKGRIEVGNRIEERKKERKKKGK
jgi:hypothetical protein